MNLSFFTTLIVITSILFVLFAAYVYLHASTIKLDELLESVRTDEAEKDS